MLRIFVASILLLTNAAVAPAQTLVTPVMGDIELTTSDVSCPSQPSGCYLCINDEDTTGDNRLILALGASSPFLVTVGHASGVVRPFVMVDGVRLTPDMLPCGAFFRSGLYWFDRFTPPACSGTPPNVTYQIGSMPEVTVTGDGTTDIEIPAIDAMEVPFEISLCSMFIYWGGGCGISGSSDESWELFVPAAMNAADVPGGGVPVAMPGSEFVVALQTGGDGVVSVSHVMDDPPVGSGVEHINGYWDVHSDLTSDTFVANVSFGFDTATLPPDVDPAAITVAIFDESTGNWTALPTVVDVTAETATATTSRLHKFVLLGNAPVPVKQTSWGAIKALYAGE